MWPDNPKKRHSSVASTYRDALHSCKRLEEIRRGSARVVTVPKPG